MISPFFLDFKYHLNVQKNLERMSLIRMFHTLSE